MSRFVIDYVITIDKRIRHFEVCDFVITSDTRIRHFEVCDYVIMSLCCQ